jgi:hypothetical protein
MGVVIKRRVDKHFDLRQKGSHGAGRSGFGCATLAADKHATDTGIYRVQDEGAFHTRLANNGSKWINREHSKSSVHLIFCAIYILS